MGGALARKITRQKKMFKYRSKHLHKCPQKQSFLLPHRDARIKSPIIVMTPRKPNSGKRKVGWVKIGKQMVQKYEMILSTKNVHRPQMLWLNKNLNGNPIPLLRRMRKTYKYRVICRLPGNIAILNEKHPNTLPWNTANQGLINMNRILLRGGRTKDTPSTRYRWIHRNEWRESKQRKRSDVSKKHSLPALPWQTFKQRRSRFGIRAIKYLIWGGVELKDSKYPVAADRFSEMKVYLKYDKKKKKYPNEYTEIRGDMIETYKKYQFYTFDKIRKEVKDNNYTDEFNNTQRFNPKLFYQYWQQWKKKVNNKWKKKFFYR